MGFYSNVLMPWLMDRSMADPAYVPHRRKILAGVSGNVLEIGFGSGIKLPYYPHQVNNGLSDRPRVQRWQHRLTPLNKTLADGCHPNRNIQHLVEAHFAQVSLDRLADDSMTFMGQIYYKGIATKATSASFFDSRTEQQVSKNSALA